MPAHPVDWAETYRPRTLAEIIGNGTAVEQLKSWADSWSKGKPKKKGVILVGDPGIGKTSAAHALAADYGWDVVELNASDSRNAASVDKIVGHGSRADSFSSDGSFRSTAEGQLKLIIFDEADNLFGREDYGGAKAIVHAMKESAQPIILIVNDYYELTRRASGIKLLAITVKFTRPSAQHVAAALERIAAKERLEVSVDAMHRIAANAGGDIRAAVNDLQSVSLLDGVAMDEVTNSLGWRDVPPETFETLEDIFSSNDLIRARQSLISLGETPEKFMMWLDDNLPRVIRDPLDRSRGIDMMSRADVFLGRVSRRMYYGLWSYASDLMSMGVCQIAQDKYPIYSDSLRFPEYLMRLSRTKAKRAAISSLLDKLSVAVHTSPSTARESMVPYIRSLYVRDQEFAVEMTRLMDLQAGEVALLLGVESDSDEVERMLAPASRRGEKAEDAEDDSEPPAAKQLTQIDHQRSLFEFR